MMKKTNKTRPLLGLLALIVGAALSACGGGERATAEHAQTLEHKGLGGGSAMTWSPSPLAFSINPGAKQEVPVSFTSSVSISNVSVTVVPELRRMVSVTPASFASIGPGQQVTVIVKVSPGASESPQLRNGTIRLVAGKSTIATPLPVLITLVAPESINGVVVPPEPPPELNDATLAGFDTNSNGVRDDVERKLVQTFNGTADLPFAIAAAREYQKEVAGPTPQTRTEALAQVARLLCAVRGASRAVYKSGIGDQIANTAARKQAERAFNDVLVGYTPRELPSCAN